MELVTLEQVTLDEEFSAQYLRAEVSLRGERAEVSLRGERIACTRICAAYSSHAFHFEKYRGIVGKLLRSRHKPGS